MLYHNMRVMAHSLRFVDTAAIFTASWAAETAGASLFHWAGPSLSHPMIAFSFTTAVSFLAMGQRMSLYHAHRTEHGSRELRTLFEVVLYSAALGCAVTQIGTRGLPRGLYVAIFASVIVSLLTLRAAMRIVVRSLRRQGRDTRTWLIIGNNRRSSALIDTIRNNPHFGIRIEDVFDLPARPEDSRGRNDSLFSETHARQISSPDGIRLLLLERAIDEVVITLPMRSFYDEIQKIIDICCEAGVSVKVSPQIFERSGFAVQMSVVGDTPMMTHFTGTGDSLQLILKRLIDVVGASAGLILLSPLFLIIAIAVKLTSSGSLLFVQSRVGLHGRKFRMYKFRSMTQDAPMRRAELLRYNASDEVVFKMKNDPRITSAGRVLRKFHLDELPQLWNVLIGDMSLVGPRPLPLKEAECKEWWHRRRLSMPPGLTCFWQVAGDHLMPFQNWMKLDVAYVDQWSVWLDFKILYSTIGTIAKGKGW